MKALFKFIEKYGFFLLGFFLVCFIVMVLNGFDLSSFTAFASEANAEATKTVILDNVRYVPKKTDFMALVSESAKDVTPRDFKISELKSYFQCVKESKNVVLPYICYGKDHNIYTVWLWLFQDVYVPFITVNGVPVGVIDFPFIYTEDFLKIFEKDPNYNELKFILEHFSSEFNTALDKALKEQIMITKK